ncbi:prepilin-type N-terminal cleavage/methylation domain-containing protein [Myxococcota bacterium]|nr:prepilin-type N-terminal cleavage/methylation domain-containing protein [Myxococcota bacterium]
MKTHRIPRSRRRGFSLVELAVSAAVGMAITGAAFELVRYQARQVGLTSESVTASQAGRASLNLLVEDLAAAGSGVGYTSDGAFGGLRTGAFTVGGAAFVAQDRAIQLAGGAATTDDLGLLSTRGPYATIAAFNSGGSGELCNVPGMPATTLAVMRAEDELAAQSVRMTLGGPQGCSRGACVDGCVSFHWSPDGMFASDGGAWGVSYVGGELAAGLATIVWFVDVDAAGNGHLRRATFDEARSCSVRGPACGDLIAEDVETLQFQVWRFDPLTRTWINATNGPLDTTERLRVDLELVVRSRATNDRTFAPVALRLEEGTCIPGCSTRDGIERRAFRTSVEIKNTGRMRMR